MAKGKASLVDNRLGVRRYVHRDFDLLFGDEFVRTCLFDFTAFKAPDAVVPEGHGALLLGRTGLPGANDGLGRRIGDATPKQQWQDNKGDTDRPAEKHEASSLPNR